MSHDFNWKSTRIDFDRLKQFDEIAWANLDQRFRRMLVAFGLKLGLSRDEAEDVAQGTLASFVNAIRQGHFDPERGTIQSYLYAIYRNHNHALRNKRAVKVIVPRTRDGQSFWDSVPATPEERAMWDQTWATSGIEHCLDILRNTEPGPRFDAFYQRFCLQRPVQDVATGLGLTKVEVYRFTFQLKRRLRDLIRELLHDESSDGTALSG